MIVDFPSQLPSNRPWVFSFGVFDGVHRGHQAIFKTLCETARRHQATPAAIFFSPHPRMLFSPETAPLPIGTPEQNIEWMRRCGIETFIHFPFTRQIASLSPQDFLQTFFWKPSISVRAFCVGENWRFGSGNHGDGNTLQALSAPYGIETIIVPSVMAHGTAISSTRIRQAVLDGDMTLAAELLGRPFTISGVVSHGKQLGTALLDCPTANLPLDGRLLPPYGVYAARGRLDSQETVDGIAYIGDAPSIRKDGPKEVLLELHLFDFNQRLYGRPLDAELIQFLRPSIHFDSPSLLQQQIATDIIDAKRVLAAAAPYHPATQS